MTPSALLRLSPARRALLALALGGFGIGTGEYVIIGLLPNVAANLHVSIPRAGNLISAYALGVVIGAPLLTPVSAWMPRKRFVILGALALAAGNFASAAMPNFTTLVIVRFLAGLPHGGYFGVSSVIAARMVRESRRSAAMSIVFAGLTFANVAGVPLATLVGQHSSWRLVFVLVGVVEVLAALAILIVIPASAAEAGHREEGPQLKQELRAFRNPQIWLALAIATIGGGAMFCTFSYIAPMMTHLAGYSQSAITPLLVLFGVGMTAGNLVGARLADRSMMRTIYIALAAETAVAAIFFVAARNEVTAAVIIVAFPACALTLLPALQNKIVALAGGAPNIAAASIHAAFNIANSLGAWLGGVTIAAGLGYAAPNLAAAGLALAGLGVAFMAGHLDQRIALRPARSSA